MVRYLYALDSEKEIVSADSLVGALQRGSYTCVSCGRAMIARVNGGLQTPHFGHKAKLECNGETYLHNTAKKVFASTYLDCLSKDKPFMISFSAPRVCNRYKPLTGKTCDVSIDRHKYDLTDYYTELKVEKKHEEFVPDVSLHSSLKPENVVYIEIAVSHFLSEKKKTSGKRIIEITIESEDDIEQIRTANISDEHASFQGFTPKIRLATDSQCECVKDNYFAFYLFHSGKCFLDNGSLESIRIKLEEIGDKIAWKNLVLNQEIKEDSFGFYHPQTPDKVFMENVKIAHDLDLPFKNCNLCRHHEKSYSKTIGGGIYCKWLNVKCNSNDANSCSHYSQHEASPDA